jgi:hypothetical protein
MNTNPILSFPTSATTLVGYRRVKLDGNGELVYAGIGDGAIGTLQPLDLDRNTGAVQTLENGLHFATIGNATAVAVGDELQEAADGKLVKKTTGAAVSVALQTAAADGDVIRVRNIGNGGPRVLAQGIHTWAGGAATTDSITVAGLVATDIVLVTLIARAAAEVLAMAANDAAGDQIDLTLSANGTNGTTKLSYLVIRP